MTVDNVPVMLSQEPTRTPQPGGQGKNDDAADLNAAAKPITGRAPFPWWNDWLRVKKERVRTPGVAFDPSEAAVYSACLSHELPAICPQSTFTFGSVAEGQARFSGAAMSDTERPFARVYSRLGNPTTLALERTLLALECGYALKSSSCKKSAPSTSTAATSGAEGDNAQQEPPPVGALVTASGMGAISAVLMSLMTSGDHIICGTVYGCTHSLMKKMCAQFNITLHVVNVEDLDSIRSLLDKHGSLVRCVYVESVENPTLRVADLEAISALTEPRGVPFVVDNTFATGYNTQPFRLGADIVVHSLTKYANGHSTAIGGAILGPWGFVMGDCFGWYKDLGSTPSPFDCWNTLQNMQDLPLRVARQSENAYKLARALEAHSCVSHVWYPGLTSHEQHGLAKQQMRTGGGMISFEVRGGYDAAVRLMDSLAKHGGARGHTQGSGDDPTAAVHLCVSLGAVTTYIQHPASMTHKCIPAEERQAMGITDALVRVSVGIDDPDTLMATFEKALSRACGPGLSADSEDEAIAAV